MLAGCEKRATIEPSEPDESPSSPGERGSNTCCACLCKRGLAATQLRYTLRGPAGPPVTDGRTRRTTRDVRTNKNSIEKLYFT